MMYLPGSYQQGFAPRDFEPRFPQLWRGCVVGIAPCLGPTGGVARDWSSFQRHAILTNMTLSTAWEQNGGRTAFFFSGTDAAEFSPGSQNRVVIPGNLVNGVVSLSFWINLRTANKRGIFANGPTNTSPTFAATVLTNRTIEVYRGANTASTTALTLGEWTHVAIISDGTTTDYYFNGRFSNSASQTINPSTQTEMYIGYNYWGALNGSMDDLILYNRKLHPAEIALLSTRRGIAYEPRIPTHLGTSEQFLAAWLSRQSSIIGGGVA